MARCKVIMAQTTAGHRDGTGSLEEAGHRFPLHRPQWRPARTSNAIGSLPNEEDPTDQRPLPSPNRVPIASGQVAKRKLID